MCVFVFSWGVSHRRPRRVVFNLPSPSQLRRGAARPPAVQGSVQEQGPPPWELAELEQGQRTWHFPVEGSPPVTAGS